MINSEVFKKIQKDEKEKERVLRDARIEASKKFAEEERIRVVQEEIPAIKKRIQDELEDIVKNPYDKYNTTVKRTVRIDYGYYNLDEKDTIYKAISDYIKSLGYSHFTVEMYYYPGSDAPYDWSSSGIMITFDPWRLL